MASNEINERIQKYPLSKNELVDYIMRIQQSQEGIDAKTYERLVSYPKFKEIIDEVQTQRTKKKECKRIMDLCLDIQKDTNATVQKVNH